MRVKLVFPISLALFAICLIVAGGCKKTTTTEPDPDLANAVTGIYSVSAVSVAGSTQPLTGSGSLYLVRNGTSVDKADLTLTYATAGSTGSSTFSETKTLSLQRSGSTIDLYNGTTKVGNWTSTLLTITSYPFNNSTISFTATKQ